ncbi:transcriptional regulator, XRE family [Methanosalsum zhilinae DSM 4017]|uniref:Transcriptional regulator, XRE family n=1 Tax=Methanosalsum zhilinae (strain DSM 4017 / NBRC 107636 / OCM 62 / WeN5) TaxID=679901 RepID=F7XLB2_METZD|nr:XRE family transcriptional regulator [Methanosalsum zhilinae]AEH60769.1 transcriptional regulator, XRE family [Methanosalsum zhilinae DSM 4017]
MSEQNYVGSKVRQLREIREMSLEDLADTSQCCIELIEHIESGDLIPSLAPLLQISRGLGVRLGTLLDGAEQDGAVMVKNGNSENVVRFSGNASDIDRSTLDFYSLAADKKDRHMEPFIIDIRPSLSEEINLSSHEGEEFIYVLEGEISLQYGEDKYILSKGDSIYYDSVIPHHLYANGDSDAQILAVVYAPF